MLLHVVHRSRGCSLDDDRAAAHLRGRESCVSNRVRIRSHFLDRKHGTRILRGAADEVLINRRLGSRDMEPMRSTYVMRVPNRQQEGTGVVYSNVQLSVEWTKTCAWSSGNVHDVGRLD